MTLLLYSAKTILSFSFRSLFLLLQLAISINQATTVEATHPTDKSFTASSKLADPLDTGMKRITEKIAIINMYSHSSGLYFS